MEGKVKSKCSNVSHAKIKTSALPPVVHWINKIHKYNPLQLYIKKLQCRSRDSSVFKSFGPDLLMLSGIRPHLAPRHTEGRPFALPFMYRPGSFSPTWLKALFYHAPTWLKTFLSSDWLSNAECYWLSHFHVPNWQEESVTRPTHQSPCSNFNGEEVHTVPFVSKIHPELQVPMPILHLAFAHSPESLRECFFPLMSVGIIQTFAFSRRSLLRFLHWLLTYWDVPSRRKYITPVAWTCEHLFGAGCLHCFNHYFQYLVVPPCIPTFTKA